MIGLPANTKAAVVRDTDARRLGHARRIGEGCEVPLAIVGEDGENVPVPVVAGVIATLPETASFAVTVKFVDATPVTPLVRSG